MFHSIHHTWVSGFQSFVPSSKCSLCFPHFPSVGKTNRSLSSCRQRRERLGLLSHLLKDAEQTSYASQ